ncbi:unnamed protein product [Rotaria sp. Silwood1]|nr:unnamed protein product [Rotaria sp. Silwood1]CAF1648788.1 unnamed protein product [Rotaria sp. Silwood1]CAF3841208.1 unnamed protein product [Rotaria sp. Silwood1]CAF3862876.1 unnamed protein product [Rotaria sp. Silwood1]CAF4816477.1 unnamed protein product [Rotaria sp. Silwood1]
MKCLALIAVLCFFGMSAGQGITMDFLNDNVVNPMLQQIQTNALGMLSQQISGLFSSLFTDLFGKRDLSDRLNINLKEVLAPFIAQVKAIYQRLFTVFVQIVQHVEDWIQKPDWARIEFVRAGAEAEAAVSKLHPGAEFLQPLVNLVQTHLHALIPDFEAIIVQLFGSLQNPVQSLIGTGSLLQP